ncbi:MAG: family 3 adenylate cyclase [Solirubrobacterales bacterium]|nr:family 3 adenylate cyclase [Solirubrobacterales bacterium]
MLITKAFRRTIGAMADQPGGTKLTPWQRAGARRIRRKAGRRADEPLKPEDWEVIWRLHEYGFNRVVNWVFAALPRSPRCGVCGAPFAGVGRWVAGPLGYRPSRKNPTVCATCVELAPPGGMKMPAGILFADLRGFTARFDGGDPQEASAVLRRFYGCAEDVLFPKAVIDKLIGDEVMALYLPEFKRDFSREDVPTVMLEHARGLLRAVGYGSQEEPFVEMGIGLDFGEAFVGNIGQRALYDFTAVGDVVNTAARLQAQAAGGEIVLSERVADGLSGLVGTPVQLQLKGKSEPQTAYRVGL